MTSRWYQSRFFWFGLPGLLFVLWIWFAYLGMEASVSWGTRKAEYCLGCGDSSVGFVVNKHVLPYTGLEGSPEQGFYWRQDLIEPEYRNPIFARALSFDTDRIGIFVGNWIIAVFYLTIWLGGLAIWQRRKRR